MEAPTFVPLLLSLAMLHSLAFIDRTMIGGALPLVRQSIAMTDAQAGWVVGTAFALPYGAAALAIAVLRRNPPASTAWLVGGVLIWSFGSMATGLAGSVAALTVARAAIGIGQGIFVPMAIGRLLDQTAPAARGKALGVFTSGATFGRSTALLTVGVLLSVFAALAPSSGVEAWRLLFILTALPNFLVVAALAKGPVSLPAAVPELRDMERRRCWQALWPFFPVAVAPVLLAQAVLSWLPTLLVRDHALSTPEAAVLVGTLTLVAAPAGPVIAGWLIGRRRSWERRVPSLVLLALTTSVLFLAAAVWAPGLTATLASLSVMLVVLGMASFGGLFGVQLLVPPDARVSVNGVFLAFITTVGVGLGPLIAGVLTSVTSRGGSALGHALLLTGGIAVVLCAVSVAGAHRSFARTVAP